MAAIFISHSSKDNDVSADIAAHLQAAGHSSLFLDFDPANGIPAGRSWEQELYAQLRGCRAVIVLCSPASMESDWCFAEITHAKSMGKQIFPIKIAECTLRPVLTDMQVIDMTAGREAALVRLDRGLMTAGLDPTDVFQWDGKRPLYPGLLAFQEEDTALFFGRDTEIQDGIDQISRTATFGGANLTLVLGASGSGKSSLVRAGILPRLKRDPARWIVPRPFRPFNDPMRELAVVLADLLRGSGTPGAPATWQSVLETLMAAPTPDAQVDVLEAMVDEVRIASGQRAAHMVLTVDQFEEVLGTKSHAGAQAKLHAFRAMLRALLDRPRSAILVIGTLRSDFLGQFQTEPQLADVTYEPLTLGPMSQDGYAALIEGPAAIGGVALERGLVQTILNDTGANDALPLLAFTMRELWEKYGQDSLLQISEYEALGGLEGSVAKAAEGVMAAVPLSEAEMTDLRTAFTSMTRINEQGQFSRRPALWGDLPQRAQPLGERFVEARLLVSMQEDDTRILEVSHEALFRTWRQLRTWLEEDRDNIRLRDTLYLAAQDWADSGRDAQLLVHRGGRLEAAETLLRQPRFDIDAPTRAYVEACIAERTRLIAEARAAEDAKRRRLRMTVAALAVGFVGASGLGVYAVGQQQTAEQALAAFTEEQNKRVTQSLQSGWRALAGLNALTDEQSRETCSTGTGLGGVRGLYCQIANVTSLQAIASLAPMPVFLSGPHVISEDGSEQYDYNFKSHQIATYNPEFIAWFAAFTRTALDNPRFIKDTRALYDQHVDPAAFDYFQSYLILFDPEMSEYRQEVTQRYRANLAAYTAEDEAKRQNPDTQLEVWNQAPVYKLLTDLEEFTYRPDRDPFRHAHYNLRVAMSFWVRRSLNDTHRDFFEVLVHMMEAYDRLPDGDHDLTALAD